MFFSSVLTGITWGAAILALAILVFLVGFILIRGVKNLTLEQFAWTYNTENVTMLPAIINTVTMTVLSLLLAAPLGIFSAIYLVEYANKRGTLVWPDPDYGRDPFPVFRRSFTVCSVCCFLRKP